MFSFWCFFASFFYTFPLFLFDSPLQIPSRICFHHLTLSQLLQSRRRLSEAFKQLDALGGTPARPPLNRDFVIQLHQQLDRWNRLLDEQHQRFAECDMLVARLKSSGFVRLTEYALLERNLQSTHTQLAEELARIGAVVNGDATQSQRTF